MAGTDGRRRLLALWEQDRAGYDDHPLTLLRQEWFHAYSINYTHPGFWLALDDDALVLDYGAGVGAVCLPWIMRGGLTRLIDSSPVVLDYLKVKYRDFPMVLPQTVAQWERSTLQYDALICTDVLEHVHDPMPLQARLWECLKPGGHALLAFSPAYPHAGHLEASVAQVPQWAAWVRYATDIVELEQYAWVKKRNT